MAQDNIIYSVIVHTDKQWFYGTFNNRKAMIDSLKENLDLQGAYIKGTTKKLDITPVTLFNGLSENKLVIYKDNEKGDPIWFIKILMHQINCINPYFKEIKSKQTSLF